MRVEQPKLRSQLLGWLLVPLFALLMVDSFVSYWVANEFAQRAYDRSLLEIARELSLHIKPSSDGPVLDLSSDSRDILLGDPEDRIRYELRSPDGTHTEGDRLPPSPARRAHGRVAFFDAVGQDSARVRVVELPVSADAAKTRPAALVRVSETVNKRDLLAREILLSVVLPQAVLILVAGLVVWVGVVHGLAPLEQLRRALVARSHGDRSPLATAGVPAEVRPLLESINELVVRLDMALTAQSRFISDAAHQLKTPVTVLKTQLELAMREGDAERMRQALASCAAGVERLSRLVSQLLSLARNEPEAAAILALRPLDLNALVLEVSQEWVPEALKKRIDLGFDPAPSPVAIRGDDGRLREMLDNLLDNAVRYTPAGGRVTVRVAGGSSPIVEVSDDGPRIPTAERERVFARFHRLLGNVEQGSGLGLAIAREIAMIHGARIELRDDDDGLGNSFRVVFPPP